MPRCQFPPFSHSTFMMPSYSLPPGAKRAKLVHSFEELVNTPFTDGINALCWPRALEGDFAEVVAQLGAVDGIQSLDDALLRNLTVSDAGRIAVDRLRIDLRLLQEHGLSPVLDCITAYPRDEAPDVVPTDVYSWHADSAPIATDTYLCTYHGATSEGLLNEDSIRRVDVPETRAELLKLYDGPDDESFAAFLNELCYDLHYQALPHAQPFAFGLGNLWRIATANPESPVPPCIHRAPENLPGQPARLLLIS